MHNCTHFQARSFTHALNKNYTQFVKNNLRMFKKVTTTREAMSQATYGYHLAGRILLAVFLLLYISTLLIGMTNFAKRSLTIENHKFMSTCYPDHKHAVHKESAFSATENFQYLSTFAVAKSLIRYRTIHL